MSAIYLAAQFGRRRELAAYAADLRAAGHEVTSRWLEQDNDAIDATLMTSPEHAAMIPGLAVADLDDIAKADVFVSFTEHPDTPTKRGGRHVEFGYAIENGLSCIVVGHRENIFHHLPGVAVYATWPEALRARGEVRHDEGLRGLRDQIDAQGLA